MWKMLQSGWLQFLRYRVNAALPLEDGAHALHSSMHCRALVLSRLLLYSFYFLSPLTRLDFIRSSYGLLKKHQHTVLVLFFCPQTGNWTPRCGRCCNPVGCSSFVSKYVEDTTNFSFGVDRNIIIERKILKDKTSKKIFSSKEEIAKSFAITVENKKQIPVEIVVFDQVPVSKNKEIEVDITELSRGVLSPENGNVKWILNLNPGEAKVLMLTYKVKYPNGNKMYIEWP